ncbi:MAG TPA: hypothetical protein VHV32_19340 [Candidatus Angelobacter sp.]|jgi:hypothetical protein|nr:hypothetical protein [Candidatus Angelobacter sp.]
MFKHLILPWLLPIFGMFFSAGADALGAGGGEPGAVIESGAEGDLGYGSDVEDTGAEEHADLETKVEDKPVADKEEPEASEFRVPVGRRMVGLVNKYPKLKEAFATHPELQKELEPVFRREAAFREVFPTVAEARQLRDALPNGLQDLQQLQSDLKETEQLDSDFYTKDREGNYPGHARIAENMFRDDKEAAVSFFRGLPKQWAQLDRSSYNEVMGNIVGATIANSREFEILDEAIQSGDAKAIAAAAHKILGWAGGYLKGKPQPSEQEQQLQRERQNFTKEQQDRDKQDGQKFHSSFVAESKKLQSNIIKGHPAVKKLLENKVIPDAKKADIIEQVRKNVESLLGKSPSFMRKLQPAYQSRNLDEVVNLQKAAWSQQWLLNRMVRTVFSKEIPQLVQNNRETVKRRAGAPPVSRPGNTGDKKDAPQGPKQIGGRWYRDGGKGAPFSTAEVLAGKHLL